MRKKFFVTSLETKKALLNSSKLTKQKKMFIETRNILRMNKERMGVIRVLAQNNKRVIITIPKTINPPQIQRLKSFVEKVTKETGNKKIRLVKLSEIDYNYAFWQRDSFIRLANKKVISKLRAKDFRSPPKKEKRIFGDGGRIIRAGKANGREVLLVSSSLPPTSKELLVQQQKLLKEESELLRKRGYTVFELPGFDYKRMGRKLGSKARTSFFEHIDVFINTIPKKRIIMVDPDYYTKNITTVHNIAKELKFKILKIPQSEKYFYPANFLNMGNGEIIIDKKAKKTIKVLKELGVNVFETPSTLQGNNYMQGGVRCFVNTN